MCVFPCESDGTDFGVYRTCVWGGVLNASPSPAHAHTRHACTRLPAPHRHPPHHSDSPLGADSPSAHVSSQSHGMRSSVGAVAGLTTTLPTGPLTCMLLGTSCDLPTD